jgi:N-methylhydantoinase A
MLQTNIRKDFSEPYFYLDEDIDPADMASVLRSMEVEGLRSLVSEGVPEESRRTTASVDVRYQSQEFSLNVPLASADEPESPDFVANLAVRFSTMYHERYGHSNLGAPIEIVALRTQAVGDLGRLEAPLFAPAESSEFKHEIRRVVFDHVEHDTTVVRRDDLAAGHKFEGPAIIVEQTATTVVPPGFDVAVDEFGSLVIRTQDVEEN